MPVLTGCYDDDGITYIKSDRVGYGIILKIGRLDCERYFKSIVSLKVIIMYDLNLFLKFITFCSIRYLPLIIETVSLIYERS